MRFRGLLINILETIRRNKKKTFVIILFLGLLFRFFYVFIIHPPENYLFSDADKYYESAKKISKGIKENVEDTFYPPATPFVYSVFFYTKNRFRYIKLFNVLISTLTCILVFLISKCLFGNLAAFFGFFVSSFNCLFIDFTGYLMSETLYTFVLAMMFYCFLLSIIAKHQKYRKLFSILAGLFLIIAGAVKAAILLFIPFFCIWWFFNFKKYKIFWNSVFYCIGFIPLAFLLALRFYSLTHEIGLISSNAGFNFFQGRSHINLATFVDKKGNIVKEIGSPVAIYKNYLYNDTFKVHYYNSNWFYHKGIEEIKKDIPRTIAFSVSNFFDLFISIEIWPTCFSPLGPWIKVANILFVFLIIIPAVFFLFYNFPFFLNGHQLLVTFPVLVIVLTSIIYYGDPRFRVPFDIFFIIIASFFYSQIYHKLKIDKI
jgi:4-amino-4-deoxy-L-arabinose transferase-like glycosyltransferase